MALALNMVIRSPPADPFIYTSFILLPISIYMALNTFFPYPGRKVFTRTLNLTLNPTLFATNKLPELMWLSMDDAIDLP